VHQHLAFVVDAAAPVDVAVAHRRFERRRFPERDRILGLHVVMSVDQHGRRAGSVQPRTVGDRQAVGFEHFRFGQPGRAHSRDDRLRRTSHLSVTRRVGRNRGAGDPVAEFAQVAVVVAADKFDEFFCGDHSLIRFALRALNARNREVAERSAPVGRDLVAVDPRFG
jgi:hypothetical protein